MTADFRTGYHDALSHGPSACASTLLAHDASYMYGFNSGIYSMNNSIPVVVHDMLRLLHFQVNSKLDTRVSFTTPPLSSFARRSVHVFMQPIRKEITIVVKGRKEDRERRMEMRYDGTRSKTPHMVYGQVKILDQHDVCPTSTPVTETDKSEGVA